MFRPGGTVTKLLQVLSSRADAEIGNLAPKFQEPCEVQRRKGAKFFEATAINYFT